MMAITMPSADWDEIEYCRNLRQTFDAYAAQHASEPTKGVHFRWRAGSTITDAALGNLARAYDLTVLSRPGSRGVLMSTFESARAHGAAVISKVLGSNGPDSLERQH